jgi:thymidylate synthase
LLNKILTKGIYKLDRTNIGILSVFGKQLKFNVRNWRLPLYTHRKIFVRGIIEELLFFISGQTDTKLLENKKVNIWKGHTSREFLESRNLQHYDEGEYGPMYGYLLRHWGYPYQGKMHDYTNKGIDQLEYVINEIKTNPTSRRILFSYWNPSVFAEQPLYTCHIMYQFYVDIEKNEISCMFTMRSNDFALANCFNVCSATLLLFMICKITNYNPGKVVYNVNDCHVYKNQIDEINKFKNNKTNTFPLCYLDDNIKTITDYKYKHFKILFYNPTNTDSLTIPMAI